MKKISGLLLERSVTKGFFYLAAAACWLVFGSATYAQTMQPRLWITDDFTRSAYEVTLNGELLSSFPIETTLGAPSEIDFDRRDGTLWIVSENPGRLINFSTTGDQLGEPILAASFGTKGTEGVAVAIDGFADVLWVVDDPVPGSGQMPTVFEVEKNGTVVSRFATAKYDPASISPQGIAIDPFDGTLWIVDNSTDTIYNVERTGELIQSLPLGADTSFDNLQGITVSTSDGSLWVSDRGSDRIYNLSRTTGAEIFSFSTSSYDPASENATGIAYQPSVTGIVEMVSVLAFNKAKFKLEKGAIINGDVGIAENSEADLKDGEIAGTLFIDPDAKKIKLDKKVPILGGSVMADLSRMVAHVLQTAKMVGDLKPTQEFGEIKESTTIFGDSGLNVIQLKKIKLKDNTLTLVGDAQSEFVFNVTSEMAIEKGSVIVLQGGVTPNQVIFNLLGKDKLQIKDESIARGTFLVLGGEAEIEKNSLIEGAIFVGKELKISDSELVGAQ